MFVYNMYLESRNLSDRNARRPNALLLVTSTLLFMMITAVRRISSGGTPSGIGFSCNHDPSDGLLTLLESTRAS